MKYNLFLFILAGCIVWTLISIMDRLITGSPPADAHPKQTYEVTCPMSMTSVVVDTVQGDDYTYYQSKGLSVYTFEPYSRRRYPSTCVVKILH